jgi:hypothetical protein
MLDDRLVLSALAALPATPAPTASPFGAAHIGKFEHDLKRVDHGLKIHAKHSKLYVTNRVTYIQSAIARAASRANVQVQHVAVTSNASSSGGPATHGRALNNRVDRLVASFNSSSSAVSTSGPGVPSSAIESNFLGVRAGFSSAVGSSTSRIGAQTITASNGTRNVSVSPSQLGSTTTSSSATAGAGASAASTSTGIGVIGTQVFSNASTQAAGSTSATISGVGASLQQAFGTLETQAGNNIATAITTFSSAPSESFQPTVGFVPGNGVTLSGT